MKLHEDKELFTDIIARAAEHPSQGGLGVRPQFIEKDYWITNALKYFSESPYRDIAVFKGGTSLSKAYHIGMRFSEDIDIAIIKTDSMTDAQLKTASMRPGQILFEINSFANPYPYQNIEISSFAYDYLAMHMANDIIIEFGLQPFRIKVLDKRTTMTEKMVSLIRFSLAGNPITELEAKIRHFYDLHYLLQDPECKAYLFSSEFAKSFKSLITHDKDLFSNPAGWREKSIKNSPLLTDFSELWNVLKKRYSEELPPLSYSLSIPSVDAIAKSMKEILDVIKNLPE